MDSRLPKAVNTVRIKSVVNHLKPKVNYAVDQELMRSREIAEASAAGKVVVRDEVVYTAENPLDLRGVSLDNIYVVRRSDGTVPSCPVDECSKSFAWARSLAKHLFMANHYKSVVIPLRWVCIRECKVLGSNEIARAHFAKHAQCSTDMIRWLDERKISLKAFTSLHYMGPLPTLTAEQVKKSTPYRFRAGEYMRCFQYTNWHGGRAEQKRIKSGLPPTGGLIPSTQSTSTSSQRQMPSQEASELSTAVGVSPLNEASSEIRWSRQPALVLTPEVPPSSPELLATLPPETSEKMEESLYGYSFGFDTEPSASGVQPEHRSCVSGTNINHPLMPMLPTQAVVPSATPSTYFEHSTSLSVASTLPSTSLTADTQSHVFPHDDSLLYLDAATGQVDWLADVAALDAHAAQCRPILAHFGGSIPPGHSNGVRYPPAGQDSQNMVHHDRSSYPSQQSSWNTGAQAYPPAPAEPMAIPPSNSFYGSSYEASSGRMASGTRARRDYRAVPYHQGLAPTAFPV